MSRAPGMMHIPMRFTFSKQAVDERAIMTKGADPVHHRMVLDKQPKQIQSMDVDFADAERQGLQVDVLRVRPAARQRLLRGGRVPRGTLGPRRGRRRLAEARRSRATTRPSTAARWTSRAIRRRSKKKGPKIEAVNSGLDGGTKVASNDDVGGSERGKRRGAGGRQRRRHGAGQRVQQDVRGRGRAGSPERLRLRGGGARRERVRPGSRAARRCCWAGPRPSSYVAATRVLVGWRTTRDARRSRRASEGRATSGRSTWWSGEERLLRDQVVAELRAASLAGGVAAFNEDKFTAGRSDVEAVVSAARTVPMMAPRRFVLLRGAERWDASEAETSPFDRLAEYAASPIDSTCLVVVASKLDGRRKFAQVARKQGLLVACDPLDARALPEWIVERFAAKGHEVDRDVAELLAALAGPQLSSVDDAIERLSLYAGPGAVVDEAAVGACVARVRTADTWALVDAVGARDLGPRPAHAGRRVRSARARPAAPRGARLVDPPARALPGGRPRRRLARRGSPPRGRLPAVPRARAREQGPRRAGEGGRAVDARPGRDGPGPEELSPRRRCNPRGHADAALP